MDKIVLWVFFFLVSSDGIAQDKSIVHLFFDDDIEKKTGEDEASDSTIINHSNNHRSNTCQKIVQENGTIDFYIDKQFFEWEGSREKDTCTIEAIGKITFSNIGDLIKKVEETNPLYPSSVFEKVYIVEKLGNNQFVKYDVEWRHYIE